MPYRLPTFNLLCNVWTKGSYPGAPRLVNVPCNLTPGRRSNFVQAANPASPVPGLVQCMFLLLPKNTDIRDKLNLSGEDTVECPAGSQRIYVVLDADDYGKGFANEHRFAVLIKAPMITWPTPIP